MDYIYCLLFCWKQLYNLYTELSCLSVSADLNKSLKQIKLPISLETSVLIPNLPSNISTHGRKRKQNMNIAAVLQTLFKNYIENVLHESPLDLSSSLISGSGSLVSDSSISLSPKSEACSTSVVGKVNRKT